MVPDEGGPCEIVDDPELAWHTVEEGARILARLVSDESFRRAKREHCAERARLFTRQAYLESQHELLTGILNDEERKTAP